MNAAAPQGQTADHDGRNAKVRKILELIRPSIQADGGDFELVEITPEGAVKLRLMGACVGCPSSSVTLKHGIERNLRAYVPEIRSVEAVGPHANA